MQRPSKSGPTILRRLLTITISATSVAALAGCSLDSAASAGETVPVVIGYQSKTINTVTAGTLLRAQGYFENRLAELSEETGVDYRVEWQDYDTGAPITAQMIAEKIDIGSMGDYPLLINGSRTRHLPNARTELVSVTAYNPHGALNMVVVDPESPTNSLEDLRGKRISASVGSAGHGTLVAALTRAGIDPNNDVEVLNQQPQVGASALDAGAVDAFAQFVAWPGLLVFEDNARLLYDGAELGTPTLHGVVARTAYIDDHPEVLEAFLAAQYQATDFLQQHPLEAAEIVADASGLPIEVVYLYNGPGGASFFDPTIKPLTLGALEDDVPYLHSIGDFDDFDIRQFANDRYLREIYSRFGDDYDLEATRTDNPTAIRGHDPVCDRAVGDPNTAAELWIGDETATQPAANATCLLRAARAAEENGQAIRASYVPDAELGTRWFADRSVWVEDPARDADDRFLAFTTAAAAERYIATADGAQIVAFSEAVERA